MSKFKQTEIGKIPIDWEVLSIGDIAEVVGGGTPPTKELDNFGGEIPWITPRDLSNFHFRYISRGERNITKKGLEESSAKLLPSNTVLLTTRAPVGYVAIAKNEVTTNQGFRSIIPKSNVTSDFLFYLLRINTEILKSHASGTTFGELSGSTLKSLKFAFPPLVEQRAIAHILGTLDDKIELNLRMNETLEAIARALFKSWFVDATQDGLPEGWRAVPLPEAIEVNPTRSLRKGKIAAYLDMANMPTRSARALEVYDREFGSGMRFVDGDTLVARITPCLENGKTCFVDFLGSGKIGWGSTEYIVLRSKPPLPPEFAYFLARTEEFRSFAISNMTGTSGRQRVPADCFNHYQIVVPPTKITERFGQFAGTALSKMKANDDESRTLAAIRDALLPKLLSGELRVKKA